MRLTSDTAASFGPGKPASGWKKSRYTHLPSRYNVAWGTGQFILEVIMNWATHSGDACACDLERRDPSEGRHDKQKDTASQLLSPARKEDNEMRLSPRDPGTARTCLNTGRH